MSLINGEGLFDKCHKQGRHHMTNCVNPEFIVGPGSTTPGEGEEAPIFPEKECRREFRNH